MFKLHLKPPQFPMGPPGQSFDGMKLKPECPSSNRQFNFLSNYAFQQFNPTKAFDCIKQSCRDFISDRTPNFSKNYSTIPVHQAETEIKPENEEMKLIEAKNVDEPTKKVKQGKKRKQKRKRCKRQRKGDPKHSDKPWHKTTQEMEINEVLNPSDGFESPVINELCDSVNYAPTHSTDAVDGCYAHRSPQHNFRSSLVSECESEDGFIVFESNESSGDAADSSCDDSPAANTTKNISCFEMFVSLPGISSVPSDNVDGCCSPKQRQFRSRLPSDCGSEDSFIVFDDCSRNVCDESVLYESSDEDADDVASCTTDQSQDTSDASPRKKVRFASQENLCEIHPMIQWSFAYQKARKGPWEQFALDRVRFQNRITNLQQVLDCILEPSHRNKIYKQRFEDRV